MEIKQLLLKQMGMLSSVLGLVLGVITMIGILDIRQGAMYGAIIGFISFVAFSVSFVPLATIIGFIYKGSYYLGVSLLFRTGFFVLIMMVFFVALLAALMNAFSGLVTIYVYNQLEQKPE